MSQLTLTVDMVVDIPNKSFTAKLIRVVNAFGQDITTIFTKYCSAEGLNLSSQSEIEFATESFTQAHEKNTAILP